MSAVDQVATEVRRCSSCGEAAAVCIRDWQHTNQFGATGQSTRDFACQNCGSRFTLHGNIGIIVAVVLGLLFIWTLIAPMMCAAFVAWRLWPVIRNPVVKDAPMPAIRFSAAEPARECASCGGTAYCHTITRNSSNAIPTGTDYEYRCDECQAEFTVVSIGSQVFAWFGATFLFLCGFMCMPLGLLAWLGSFLLIALSFWNAFTAWRNPLISVPVDG